MLRRQINNTNAVLHESKFMLFVVCARLVNWPHFEARTRPEADITNPNPARH